MPPTVISLDRRGFWDPITSTIDWCETNYEMSYYIAEFWNTLSNLTFILPPLIAFAHLRRYEIDFLFLSPLLYLSFVGLGSAAFHMTLKYEMQLWDEMTMIWEALLVGYIFIKMLHPPTAAKRSTKLSLIFCGLGLEISYLVVNEPIFFQLGFAAIHYMVIYLGYRITRTCPSSPRLFWLGVFLNHFAFFLWNIDNIFCSSLDGLRCGLPNMLAPILQLHAVWHVIAGFATYCMITFAIHTHLLSQRRYFYIKLHPLTGLILSKT
ncbi:alkaline ceramidase 3-like [Panonychus citri]|uniref:alkaline ceramidase 3-like n=1 Tax=Panonychus citri TaxID=50023 RepID=UPI002307E9A8|nr:alkaline ceramidase 3-like [Panonychus citri]